ncbi:CIC11C00000000169 [Sungouiella intermedia]|uniref:CIC11C00000000169 n=1 Tax=Sungouiella intermedia TaxID=45354 RepID=A0A1L0DMN8_9ASCO|nr:CIC11C00000000169 [[Candida] intermedia]SGZ58851.1 CIC11C00000004973 [[Candida] intermedia]
MTTVKEREINFQFANECDLEIHCSPFGLSGVYIKIKGTNIMGIGSTMGLITGTSKGLIHYNDCADLQDQKYKLFVVVDGSGMLRIDFTKIQSLLNASQDQDKTALEVKEEDDLPSLIFMGVCPEGHPDKVDPFIGIFSFEREE